MDATVTSTLPDQEYRIVALARRARRLPGLWMTIAVGVGIVILGGLLLGLPVFLAVWLITGRTPREWSEMYANSAVLSGLYQTGSLTLMFSGVYLVAWLWLRRYERRPFWTVGFVREGSLWGIGAQHAAWNWAQGNLFGFEVSGIAPAGGMLFNMMETGPDEITGGAFGPEGGLVITAVLLIGIAVLLGLRRSTPGAATRDD